ncbi:MAG: DMT family transporter [Pseudomonadota bacterium]
MGDAVPILLGLFSALTLAIANVAVKRGGDILMSRVGLSTTAAVLMAPAAFFVPLPTAEIWLALGFGLLAHFFYQSVMIRSLHRADLTLVFPIMRGLAPLLTAAGAFLLLDERLSPVAVLGLVIATAAVMSFALPPRGSTFRRHPDRVALGYAFLTSVGVALYTVADAAGVRAGADPFSYIVWLFMLDWVGVTAVAVVARRRTLFRDYAVQLRHGTTGGVMAILSYGAALYALSLAPAATISALRETGIVFAAIIGWLFLKEGFGLRRTLAACAVVAGLVLMQLG